MSTFCRTFQPVDGAGRHGMQIFDLAGLHDVTTAPATFQETAHYDRVGSVGYTHQGWLSEDHRYFFLGDESDESRQQLNARTIVLDVHDPTDPKEVAYLDTAPSAGNGPGFAESWTNYPYFHSGLIAVASMSEGLYIVRHPPTGTGQ